MIVEAFFVISDSLISLSLNLFTEYFSKSKMKISSHCNYCIFITNTNRDKIIVLARYRKWRMDRKRRKIHTHTHMRAPAHTHRERGRERERVALCTTQKSHREVVKRWTEGEEVK